MSPKCCMTVVNCYCAVRLRAKGKGKGQALSQGLSVLPDISDGENSAT